MSNKSGAIGSAVCMFVEGEGARIRTEYAWKRCGLALKIGREQDKSMEMRACCKDGPASTEG
jgi:hypothetical protein